MDDATVIRQDSTPSQSWLGTTPEGPPGFELLEEVGRGGMGVVYRARDRSLARDVAVKFLIDRHAADSAAAARFIEEARITGQLQHPGIPAVYQVGVLPGGRPFLAMKLIQGQTLGQLLKNDAPLDSLSVFESIAQAVGFAHAHGVIHRDLKPANIMVGSFGEVQVMDWGLAKIIRAGSGLDPLREAREDPTAALSPGDCLNLPSRGSESASADPNATAASSGRIPQFGTEGSHTLAGSVLGTPAYMAPEQAAGDLDKVDTRADVFGLGAMLCVLLTGKPPFTGETVESVRQAAVRCQTEEAFARLDASGADPEVVALCKRCLMLHPEDRPASGNEVAAAVATLRHAADDRARQAEQDKLSAEVRAGEQAIRRRAALRAAGVVVGVLLLGMVGTGIGLLRTDQARRDAVSAREAEAEQKERAQAKETEANEARHAAVLAANAAEKRRQEAETARAEAQAKEAEANAVIQFLEQHLFVAGRPKGQAGGQGSAVTLHDAILACLPALGKSFADQPLVEARLRMAVGSTFLYLGETKPATQQLERAVELFTQHSGSGHPDTLTTMNNLANGYFRLGRYGEALKLRKEVVEAKLQRLPPDHPSVLSSLHNLASSYAVLNRRAEAMKLRESVLADRKRVLPKDHPDTLNSITNLASSYYSLGRYTEAMKLWQEALEARKRVLPPNHPDTLRSMSDVARGYAALGRHADAIQLLLETQAERKQVLPPDHPDILVGMHNLANSYEALGRHEEAYKLRENVLEARKRSLPRDDPDTLISMNNLANSCEHLKRYQEALKLREEVLATRRRVLPKDDPLIASSMNNLANSYFSLKQFEEARKLYEEALAVQRRLLPKDHPDTLKSVHNLANCCSKLKRYTESLKLDEELLAARKRVLPEGHGKTLLSMYRVANDLIQLNRGAEAIPIIDDCVMKASGQRANPDLIPGLIELRLEHFRKAGDPVGCRATALMWEKLNRTDLVSLYSAGCLRAAAAGVQEKAGGANAKRLAREEADAAMAWLAKAVAAGFKDKAHLRINTFLDPLRNREDFKKLLRELKEPLPVAPFPHSK